MWPRQQLKQWVAQAPVQALSLVVAAEVHRYTLAVLILCTGSPCFLQQVRCKLLCSISWHAVPCSSTSAVTLTSCVSCCLGVGFIATDSIVTHVIRSTAASSQSSRTNSKANSVQGEPQCLAAVKLAVGISAAMQQKTCSTSFSHRCKKHAARAASQSFD